MAAFPMFPLGMVLFPHTPTRLHIFEPRYRAMAKEVTAGDGEFGVVLIERGWEVGGGDERFDVGTVARVVQAVELDDGRWGIVAVGTERLRVDRWLEDDPFPRAEVSRLSDPAFTDADRTAFEEAAQEVRRALAYLAELGERAAPATVEFDPDPARAAYQLAAVAPLGPVDQQRLLEAGDHRRRLEMLRDLVRDGNDVLAIRLAGR